MQKNNWNYIDNRCNQVILRTYNYLEQTGRINKPGHFPYLKYRMSCTNEIIESNMDGQLQRYNYILKEVSMGEDIGIISTLLDLSLASALVPEFETYLKYYTGYTATAQLALELEGYNNIGYGMLHCILQKIQSVCLVDWNTSVLPYAEVKADDVLIAYLTDEVTLDLGYKNVAYWFLDWNELHPFFVREDIKDTAIDALEKGKVVQIAGTGGKRFIAKHVANEKEKNLLFLDMEKFIKKDAEQRKQMLQKSIHSSFIYNGIWCMYNIKEEFIQGLGGTELFWSDYILSVVEAGVSVILCTDERLAFLDSQICRLELLPLTRKEREMVWMGFRQLYHLDIDVVSHSVYYLLSASEIAEVVNLWKKKCNKRERMDWSRLCYEVMGKRCSYKLGEVIYSEVDFEDLEIEEESKQILKQASYYAKYIHQVYEEQGLGSKYAYGRALTILLNGPSGTGKTMTAHAFAKNMGVGLYHVDLSQIADKYIGETEKHLEQVFQYAETTHMVLFFDEADAIFGKRTDVSDGRDRYNNMEVSYILQRIERFDGIVILATNLKKNMDNAFMRRMRYVIQYYMPDENIRYRIWKKCLPNKHNLSDYDIEQIAKRLDIAGGSIKNIILSACVIAKCESKTLQIRHVLQAVDIEYRKMGRMLSDLGELRYLM